VTLAQIFAPLKPGDVCTGTIMRYALQSTRLERLGYVKQDRGDWVFLGFKKTTK
jgi:hypothetical protein